MGLKEDLLEMKKEVEEVKEQSLALELLQDYKKANNRLFVIVLVILTMWFCTIGYLVYVLNDIETIETTRVEQSDAENNNYIGNNGDIINGTKDN